MCGSRVMHRYTQHVAPPAHSARFYTPSVVTARFPYGSRPRPCSAQATNDNADVTEAPANRMEDRVAGSTSSRPSTANGKTTTTGASPSSESSSSSSGSTDSVTQSVSAAVSSQRQSEAADARSPPDVDEVDKDLSETWKVIKQKIQQNVDPETATFLNDLSYQDLMKTDASTLLRKLTEAQFGPILAAMGLDVDPYSFCCDLIKVSLFLQFVTCGLVWYGGQNLLHLSPDAAGVATAGLALGFATRLAFKVELLLFPVYNTFISVFFPNATLEVPSSSRDAVQGTLNSVGIALALAFFLPQLLWGWSSQDSGNLVVPLCGGWFLFDLTFLAGLSLIIQQFSDDDHTRR